MKNKKPATPAKEQPLNTTTETGWPLWTLPARAAVVTFLAFFPVLKNGFINLDDNVYIYNHPLVTAPFSISGLIDIFSTYAVGNYHPLTMLLLHLIHTVFGAEPGAFHFFSLAFHVGSVVVLFYFIHRLTLKPLAAFGVALLFGVHPLHVEAVAWASSFKDVLYTFFYLCALLTYLLYIKEKKKDYLLYTGVFFLLSVLSKGMAVTLPVALLLIDVYTASSKTWNWKIFSAKALAKEKWPFWAASVVFGVIALVAQKSSGAINTTNSDVNFSAFEKWIAIPSYALVGYLQKLILPVQLSAFYTYPSKVSLIYPLIAMALLALLVWRFRFSKPVMFGSLFFLVNIILVLQFIPVGGALMADRYTYLSMVGMFFIVAVTVAEQFENGTRTVRQLIGGTSVAILITLAFLTYSRTKVWRDSKKLWYSALHQNPDNYFVHGGMGDLYLQEANADSALFHLRAALYIFPYNAPALHSSMASAYLLANQLDSAIIHSNEALKHNTALTKAYETRGEAFLRKQLPVEAMNDFHQALKLSPSDIPGIYLNMGVAYGQTNQVDSAIMFFSKSIEVSNASDSVASIAYLNRSLSYSIKGDLRKALEDAYAARSKGRVMNEQYIPQLEYSLNQNK